MPFAGSAEYANALTRAAEQNHGHAIRKFLKQLVRARAKDDAALRAWIASRVNGFVEKANIDPNDGSAFRVAEAFGLVYAAGRLAQQYGVLPDCLAVGPAVLTCYSLHLIPTALSIDRCP